MIVLSASRADELTCAGAMNPTRRRGESAGVSWFLDWRRCWSTRMLAGYRRVPAVIRLVHFRRRDMYARSPAGERERLGRAEAWLSHGHSGAGEAAEQRVSAATSPVAC